MALINIYNQISNEHKEIRASGKLKDILPDFDFTHSVILRAGERVSADVELADDDVIFVRVVPGVTTTAATVIAIVCAVVAVGVGIGAAIYANKQSEEAKEKMEKAQRDADNLASQINQLPFLKGAKNTKALGKNIQFIIGEMFNTPYLLTDGFYTLAGADGDKQFWNAVLCLGFGKQKLKTVSIGTVKVKDFGEGTVDDVVTPFDEPDEVVGNPYYDDETILEFVQQKEFKTDIFKRKVVSTQDGSEIKHDFGEDASPVIKQCAEKTKKLEVAIQFNGLRRYHTESSSWGERSVQINPYWSNDNGATWNKFYFTFPSQEGWRECNQEEIAQLIEEGKIVDQYRGTSRSRAVYSKDPTIQLFDWLTVKWDTKCTINSDDGLKVRTLDSGQNILTKNTNKTIRYVATKEFTWAETHDEDGHELPIIFKVEKVTPKLESNSTEDCYLLYYNCYCYDGKLSNAEDGLVDCKPMSDWYTEKCSFIGVQMVANESTQDVLDEINVMSSGLAKVWNAEDEEWSTDKTETRNPASWILELLTSDKHSHSQYAEDEIDLASLGELYEYCEENNFCVDAILTKGDKKNTVISNILSSCFATMYTDAETGLLTFAIDRAENTPVALLNAQCVQSVTVAKSFERKPDGIKVNFTNRNNWQIDTRYCMLDGSDSHDVEDLLTELSVEYVTDPDHAYKVAQRKMRMERLQPREVKVKIGKEGDYYPLYSTVHLQLEQMKQGIKSSVIENVIVVNNEIFALEIGDWVEFVEDNHYGIIVQCEDENGYQLRNLKVTGSGKTRTLTLINPISLSDAGILPQFKNILSFGLLDDDGEFTKVTNTMKIYGISGSNDGIELTLKDYNPDVYSYGVIPPYKSNLTTLPPKLNAVSDISFKGELNELKGKIEEVEAKEYGGSITQLSSLDPTGFTEGALGLYEQKFYRLENGAWRELSSDMYLGRRHELPQNVGEGSYFLVDEEFQKSLLLLMTSDGLLKVNDGSSDKMLSVTQVYSLGYLYERKENSWLRIEDKNDWRYVIAMNDSTALGLSLPFYIRQSVQTEIAVTTPKYLGAKSTLPVDKNIGDFFTYSGATVYPYTKGTVYEWDGESWNVDENNGHRMQALNDLLYIVNTSVAAENQFVDAFVEKLSVNEAFIEKLVAKYVVLKNGGYIKSNNYDTSGGAKGFYINTEGKAYFNAMQLQNTLLKVKTESSVFSFGATATGSINSTIRQNAAELVDIIKMNYYQNSTPINFDTNFIIAGKIFIGEVSGNVIDLENTYTGGAYSLWVTEYYTAPEPANNWTQFFVEFSTLAHYTNNTCKKGGYARCRVYESGRLTCDINYGGTTYSYDTSTQTGTPMVFQLSMYL